MKFLPPSGLLPGASTTATQPPPPKKKVALALVNLVHFSTKEEGGRRAPWPGGCELIRGRTVPSLPPPLWRRTPPKRGCDTAGLAISSTCRPLIKNIGRSLQQEREQRVCATRVHRGLNSRLITIPGNY